jgi:multicomponent Na+:H+ antiporter subunit G
MISLADGFTLVFVVAGALLFLAGTLGLLRFPDTLSRLHALSKADNLGLGLIVIGLLPQTPSVAGGVKFVCIWLLAQLSAATASQLIAGIVARRKRDA